VLGGQIRDVDRLLARELVVSREHDRARFAEEQLDRQTANIGGQPQLPDIDLAVPDDVGLVNPIGPEQLHGQMGMTAGKLADGGGDGGCQGRTLSGSSGGDAFRVMTGVRKRS
jgi:hypothetical protein